MKKQLKKQTHIASQCNIAKETDDTAILNNFIKSQNIKIKIAVAQNPNISEENMLYLSKDKCINVVLSLLKNINLTNKVLTNIAYFLGISVKLDKAKDHFTPVALLADLSNDDDFNVRKLVIQNPATPENVIRQMCINDIYSIRICAFSNPKITRNLLYLLSNDSNITISNLALQKLNNYNTIKGDLINA